MAQLKGDTTIGGRTVSEISAIPLTCTKVGTVFQLKGLFDLTGTVFCQFKASANYVAGDTFTIDDVAYVIKTQDGSNSLSADFFVNGAFVTCIVDVGGKTVNFKSGGGGIKLPPDVEEMWSSAGDTSLFFGVNPITGTSYISTGYRKVIKISNEGRQIKSATHNTDISFIAVDKEDSVYVGGNQGAIKKYSSDLYSSWTYSGHTKAIKSIVVDNLNNVYSSSYDGTIKKISKTGSLVWSYIDTANEITIDDVGNVYACSSDKSVRKISSSNSLLWKYPITETPLSIAVDKQGSSYVSTNNLNIIKINNTGTQELWKFLCNSSIRKVRIDSLNNIYVSMANGTVKKITNEGKEVWTFSEYKTSPTGLAVDASNYIYTIYNDQLKQFQQNYGAVILSESPNTIKRIYKTGFISEEIVGAKPYEIWTHYNGIRAMKSQIQPRYPESGLGVYTAVVNNQDNAAYCSTENNVLSRINMTTGQEEWFVNIALGASRIFVDLEGSVYCYGSASNGTRIKISSSGKQIWKKSGFAGGDTTTTVMGMGNNILYIGQRFNGEAEPPRGDRYIYLIDKNTGNGIKLYEKLGGSDFTEIVADSQNNVYTIAGSSLQKISSNGVRIWGQSFSNIGSMNVDLYDNLWLGNSSGNVYKINVLDGSILFTLKVPSSVSWLTVDTANYLYTSYDNTIAKWNLTNNSIIWTYTFNAALAFVSEFYLDNQGSLYVAAGASNHFYKVANTSKIHEVAYFN